jgi:Ca2+-transporting ATPase
LWTAIAGSVALQILVVYLPMLQKAFGTTPLSGSDWILCIAIASSVLWLREGSKAVIRWRAKTSD